MYVVENVQNNNLTDSFNHQLSIIVKCKLNTLLLFDLNVTFLNMKASFHSIFFLVSPLSTRDHLLISHFIITLEV